MKECNKRNSYIGSKLHMLSLFLSLSFSLSLSLSLSIYISSDNFRRPVIKTFTTLHPTTLHYTCRHFTSSHLKLQPSTYFTSLSFGSSPFETPTASFHLTSLHFTSFHFTAILEYWLGLESCQEKLVPILSDTLRNSDPSSEYSYLFSKDLTL